MQFPWTVIVERRLVGCSSLLIVRTALIIAALRAEVAAASMAMTPPERVSTASQSAQSLHPTTLHFILDTIQKKNSRTTTYAILPNRLRSRAAVGENQPQPSQLPHREVV